LPVIFYPIVVPVIIAGVKATGGLLTSAEIAEAARVADPASAAVLARSASAARAEVWTWVQILLVFDAIFLAASTWIFEHLVTE
jgi:hypothetical protein